MIIERSTTSDEWLCIAVVGDFKLADRSVMACILE